MTANRDLKRRVRDRQSHTGESYMTALQRVLAARPGSIPSAIPTVEFVDLTRLAGSLNLKCQVVASPKLLRMIDVKPTVERFRELLVVTRHDPALSLMQAVVVRGEHLQLEMTRASLDAGAAFIRGLRAGLGGVSANGLILALRGVPGATPHATPPASRGSQPVGIDEPGMAGRGSTPEWERGGIDELGQPVEVLQTGSANPGTPPAAIEEPVVVFSVSLAPSFVSNARPPLLIAMSLDEIVNDPLISLLRGLRGKQVQP